MPPLLELSPAALLFSGLACLAVASCSGSGGLAGRDLRSDSAIVAQSDSVVAELAGPPFASLPPPQRWRTIASLGRGLTPTDLTPPDLPEPNSAGAGVLQTYCTQCHWLVTPQLHAATEWPAILNAMVLRMRLVQRRVHGPVLDRLDGGNLRASVRFRAVPDRTELDSLLAYLERNAFPAASPGEIPPGPEKDVFESKCSACHEAPSPGAHTAAEWKLIVPHMEENMRLVGLDSLTRAQEMLIEGVLRSHAAPAAHRPASTPRHDSTPP